MRLLQSVLCLCSIGSYEIRISLTSDCRSGGQKRSASAIYREISILYQVLQLDKLTAFHKSVDMANQEDYPDLNLWSAVVPSTSRKDRGDIRRSADPTVQPQLGVHGCRTLYESFRCGAKRNPMGPCMGFRAVSTNGFATPFIYSSYTECLARVNSFGAGLEKLGLVQRNPDDGVMVVSSAFCDGNTLQIPKILKHGGLIFSFYIDDYQSLPFI